VPEDFMVAIRGHQRHAAKAPWVDVAQLAAIIELEIYMGVWRRRRVLRNGNELAGHSQVHDQVVPFGRVSRPGVQIEHQEFPHAPHRFDAFSGNVLLERRGIVDEIGLAQARRQNPPPRQRFAQATHHCFDFREFRHKE
jgi:hypothetical protein